VEEDDIWLVPPLPGNVEKMQHRRQCRRSAGCLIINKYPESLDRVLGRNAERW
jgi:hypothetical protein